MAASNKEDTEKEVDPRWIDISDRPHLDGEISNKLSTRVRLGFPILGLTVSPLLTYTDSQTFLTLAMLPNLSLLEFKGAKAPLLIHPKYLTHDKSWCNPLKIAQFRDQTDPSWLDAAYAVTILDPDQVPYVRVLEWLAIYRCRTTVVGEMRLVEAIELSYLKRLTVDLRGIGSGGNLLVKHAGQYALLEGLDVFTDQHTVVKDLWIGVAVGTIREVIWTHSGELNDAKEFAEAIKSLPLAGVSITLDWSGAQLSDAAQEDLVSMMIGSSATFNLQMPRPSKFADFFMAFAPRSDKYLTSKQFAVSWSQVATDAPFISEFGKMFVEPAKTWLGELAAIRPRKLARQFPMLPPALPGLGAAKRASVRVIFNASAAPAKATWIRDLPEDKLIVLTRKFKPHLRITPGSIPLFTRHEQSFDSYFGRVHNSADRRIGFGVSQVQWDAMTVSQREHRYMLFRLGHNIMDGVSDEEVATALHMMTVPTGMTDTGPVLEKQDQLPPERFTLSPPLI